MHWTRKISVDPSLLAASSGRTILVHTCILTCFSSSFHSTSLTFYFRIEILESSNPTAVPYIPEGYSEKEWQAEHEAELAELQSRKEEYIGHRGASAQPVRHFSEDIDRNVHVHFHKPDSSSGDSSDREETILQKMRRRWGRDDGDDDVLIP